MVMVTKFPDELSENDELREFELSGSDCTVLGATAIHRGGSSVRISGFSAKY